MSQVTGGGGQTGAAVETWPSSADPLLPLTNASSLAGRQETKREPNSRPADPALFIRAALAITQWEQSREVQN